MLLRLARALIASSIALLTRSSGPNDDPNLNGITLEMEACINASACIAALQVCRSPPPAPPHCLRH
jgi:hypothetical protein